MAKLVRLSKRPFARYGVGKDDAARMLGVSTEVFEAEFLPHLQPPRHGQRELVALTELARQWSRA